MPEPTPYLGSTRPSGADVDARERSAFYSSKRWMRHRRAYLAKNPLCVRCLARGLVVAARIVHHVIERLDDPSLAWDWSNFEGLCASCHTRHHNAHRAQRDADGGR